jgi:A/G-specific adenine glycosylase
VSKAAQQFQKRLLTWFDQHGRKHLPWQHNKTPYRVWVSEIMLQQTQVSTAIPYYERFMQQFPSLEQLAQAHEDQVLHLWAGLGYYSRARNLLKAAKMVMEKHQGEFPATVTDLCELPGIGQSTAGAIVAIAFNQRAPILNGNVKRVLARFHGITEAVNEKTVENQLWAFAEHYTPTKRVADYTQAMMDLGATLCMRGNPACSLCPLVKTCSAHEQGIAHLLPKKKATRELPTRASTFFILKQGKKILLCKRPTKGIWGGLWSLPEVEGQPQQKTIHAFCRQHLQSTPLAYQALAPFRHTFSHYHLDIFPILIEIKKAKPLSLINENMEAGQQIWYNPNKPESIGLPKPIQLIMRTLA